MIRKIGFIGIGVMGRSMAANLVNHGYEVTVYSRTKAKLTEYLAATDVRWCNSIAECVKGQDAVITMVGYPKDVEDVYFGENGILAHASRGSFLIDMTTTDPSLSIRIAQEGRSMGMRCLDAPVSGGDVGAQRGTLSIMVGASQEDFDACLPVFQAMGTNIVLTGDCGCGQYTKIANQIAIAGALAGVCEATAYGQAHGLDGFNMLSCISKGAAGSWQMENLGPKMLKNDFAPGFFMKHFVKDMRIACQNPAKLPVLETVFHLCEQIEQEGFGEDGTQALYRWYQS